MKTILLIATLMISLGAWGQTGSPVGCFKLATELPQALDGSPDASLLFLKDYSLCVYEKNVVALPDGNTFTGKFIVQFRRDPFVTKGYALGFKFNEGAAGSIYTTYAATAADLTGEDFSNIQFRMLNQPAAVGDIAGHVRVANSNFVLFKK